MALGRACVGFLAVGSVVASCSAPVPREPGVSRQAELVEDSDADSIRWVNGLPTRMLALNALSTNHTTLQRITTEPFLSTPGLNHEPMRTALRDPWAQKFLAYMVSCALANGEQAQWTDPVTLQVLTFHGKHGLCPSWATSIPSDACKQLVSACILARENAYDLRVVMNERGNESVFALRNSVPTDYSTHGANPAPIPSFNVCSPDAAGDRDCGWTKYRDFVGVCAPGATVELGAGSPPLSNCDGDPIGSSNGETMIRVCPSTTGCDSSTAIAQGDHNCGTNFPAVSFTCPAGGYYSVMVAPYDSSTSDAVVQVAGDPGYPAPEGAVFRFGEAVFYGDLFDVQGLQPAIDVVVNPGGSVVVRQDGVPRDRGTFEFNGSLYRNMFVCNDPNFPAVAIANHRVCGIPATGKNCTAVYRGRCDQACSLLASDGHYQGCLRSIIPFSLWNEPVTTFLNCPTDAVPLPDLVCPSGVCPCG